MAKRKRPTTPIPKETIDDLRASIQESIREIVDKAFGEEVDVVTDEFNRAIDVYLPCTDDDCIIVMCHDTSNTLFQQHTIGDLVTKFIAAREAMHDPEELEYFTTIANDLERQAKRLREAATKLAKSIVDESE